MELERPKPPRVDDRYAYWGDPPPVVSERCKYWLRQIERGFQPNRRWSQEGCDTSSEMYGVYIWEYLHLIRPALEGEQ